MNLSSSSSVFVDPASRGRPPLLKYLPALVLVVILSVELATSGVRVTPSLLMIALALFAAYFTPRQVVLWSVVFYLPLLASLLLVQISGVPTPISTIVLRSGVYFAVAILAFRVSLHRERMREQLESLERIFDGLPSPVVVSDADGDITFANQACCRLLGLEFLKVRGSAFSSLFLHPDHRGKAIEQYLKLFELKHRESAEMRLSLVPAEDCRLVLATCTLLEMNDRRLLVSQLEPVDA